MFACFHPSKFHPNFFPHSFLVVIEAAEKNKTRRTTTTTTTSLLFMSSKKRFLAHTQKNSLISFYEVRTKERLMCHWFRLIINLVITLTFLACFHLVSRCVRPKDGKLSENPPLSHPGVSVPMYGSFFYSPSSRPD